MSKIEWTDETLNPLGWGCFGPGGTPEEPKPCWYCYARRMAIGHPFRDCELCRQFIPHWHFEQLKKPLRWKKSKKIFWQSMGDLFHACTPNWQIREVISTVWSTPQHTHIFLTKNPKRYQEFNPWPENCWLGTTITNQVDADARVSELLKAQARIKFLSAEPLLGEIFLGRAAGAYVRIDQSRGPGNLDISIPSLRWLIIGAMTGPGSQKFIPDTAWVNGLISQAQEAGIPFFLKKNLLDGFPALYRLPEIQEFPV